VTWPGTGPGMATFPWQSAACLPAGLPAGSENTCSRQGDGIDDGPACT